MKSHEFVTESAAGELAKKLPSLEKHDYDTIDKLMQQIAKKHNITGKVLHDLFVKRYGVIPDKWIKKKLHEDGNAGNNHNNPNNNPVVKKFIQWCSHILKLESIPEVEFSYDAEEAQNGHHTGRHTPGENKVWVYARNRNLVDILRTVAHEFRHVQQGQQGKIKAGDSYPFSPIEKDADMWAGGIIKIFGKQHPEIYQG